MDEEFVPSFPTNRFYIRSSSIVTHLPFQQYIVIIIQVDETFFPQVYLVDASLPNGQQFLHVLSNPLHAPLQYGTDSGSHNYSSDKLMEGLIHDTDRFLHSSLMLSLQFGDE